MTKSRSSPCISGDEVVGGKVWLKRGWRSVAPPATPAQLPIPVNQNNFAIYIQYNSIVTRRPNPLDSLSPPHPRARPAQWSPSALRSPRTTWPPPPRAAMNVSPHHHHRHHHQHHHHHHCRGPTSSTTPTTTSSTSSSTTNTTTTTSSSSNSSSNSHHLHHHRNRRNLQNRTYQVHW